MRDEDEYRETPDASEAEEPIRAEHHIEKIKRMQEIESVKTEPLRDADGTVVGWWEDEVE